MCGRYLIITDDAYEEEIKNIINEVSEKYNRSDIVNGEVFPTNSVPVIYSHNGRNILSTAKWGFPNFNNNGVIINARSESVAEKPMFKNAFATKRCIVPANGYFEWLTEDKKKNKYRISVKEKHLFFMAGLYNIFNDKNGNAYAAISIVTTEANSDISFIHHRMPAILQNEAIETWLDTNNVDISNLQRLLKPFTVGKIDYKVA